MGSWGALTTYFVVSAVIVGSLVALATVLRVQAKRSTLLKTRPYECGEEPDGPAMIRFHPRYYLVALFFVLFDVEAAFFFPWAVAQRTLGWAGLGSMAAFTGVLLLGWAYAVRKGALQWQ